MRLRDPRLRSIPRSFLALVCALTIPDAATAQDRALELGSAERRIALVIGNGAYKAGPLKNPANDATDVARALRAAGFEVTLGVDWSRREMDDAIRSFGEKLKAGGVGLFYFAGHGMQVGGRNYLIPVEARLETPSDVEYEAIDAGRVLGKMEDAGNGFNIVILDACRNNPFGRSFRSAEQGLAQVTAPTGSFIAYATAPGAVAADGTGRNGTFTAALLEALAAPGLKVEEVFKRVREQVVRQTANRQVPWDSSSLVGEFYFAGVKPTPSPVRPAPAAVRPPAGPAPVQGVERGFEIAKGRSVAMVLVHPGTFTMGSLDGEDDEQPIHQVTISQAFYIGKYEVTQAEWDAVMGTNPSNFKGGTLPVDQVSWHDVQEFLKQLNAKTGGGWRLPTEAEWEYACRAGTAGDFAGDLDAMGWYDPNSAGQTHPVGTKRPNGWGLYDMHGNVWEWCADWHGSYTSDDQVDPRGIASGANRVIRGGGYSSIAASCRSAVRYGAPPSIGSDHYGLRLARSAK